MKAQALEGNPIPYDQEIRQYSYQEVVPLPELDTAQMYRNALHWLESRNSQSEFTTRETNQRLVTEGDFEFFHNLMPSGNARMLYKVTFSITLEFRSGRYRYQLKDIVLNYSLNYNEKGQISLESWLSAVEDNPKKINKGTQKVYLDSCKEIHRNFVEIIQQLKAGVGSTKKDDW